MNKTIFRGLVRRVFSVIARLKTAQPTTAFGLFTVQVPENVKWGRDCSINPGVLIVGRKGVHIGDRVTLSARVMIIDTGLEIGNKNRLHTDSEVHISDDVWIGAGAIILPGVSIGRGSVVGAGSVVSKSVPSYTVVAGNPAKVIRTLDVAEIN